MSHAPDITVGGGTPSPGSQPQARIGRTPSPDTGSAPPLSSARPNSLTGRAGWLHAGSQASWLLRTMVPSSSNRSIAESKVINSVPRVKLGVVFSPGGERGGLTLRPMPRAWSLLSGPYVQVTRGPSDLKDRQG
jgi:hypothetical protein